MANDKIKSVNTKELQNFEKALPPVFAASDTRKLVKAASKGNLEEYKDALKNYKWKFTRDYNVVLVILSVIVVAAQAINNHPKYQESDEYKKLSEKDKNALNKKIDDLKRRLDDLLAGSGSRRLLEVFKLIGSGKGTQLRADLNTFAKYRELVETLSEDNKYGQIDNPLIERASKISRWVVNKKYVNNKLLPYVTKLLGSKFASALREGEKEEPKAPKEEPKAPEDNRRIELDSGVIGPIREQLQKIFDECLTRAASQTEDDAMYDFLSTYDTKGKALYTNDVNKSYPGCKTFTVTDAKNVIFVVSDKGDLRMFFNPATFKNMKIDDLFAEGQQCIEKYLAEKNSTPAQPAQPVQPMTADLEKSLELAKDFMIAHWLNIDSFEKSKDILDSEPIEGVLHPKVKEYLLSDPELLEFCEKENDDENVVDFLKVLMYMYKAAGKDVSKISELLKKKQKSAPAQPAQPAPAPTSTTPAQPAKPAQPAQPETKVTSLSDDELGKLLSKSAGDVIEYLNSLPGKKVETDLFGTIDVQTVRDIQDLQRKTDVLKWKLPVNDKFNGYKFKQDDFEVDFTNSFFKSMYYSFVLAQAAYATSEQRARVGLDEVDQEAIDYLTKIYLPFMEAHKDLYPIGYDKQGKERFITLVRGKLGKPAQPAQPAQHEAAPQDPRVGKINAYLGDTTHNNDELFKAFKSKNDPLTIIPAKIPAELQGRWDKAPQIEAKNKIVAMASYLINSVYGGLGEKAWEGFDKTSAFGKAIKDKIESVKKKRSGKKKK